MSRSFTLSLLYDIINLTTSNHSLFLSTTIYLYVCVVYVWLLGLSPYLPPPLSLSLSGFSHYLYRSVVSTCICKWVWMWKYGSIGLCIRMSIGLEVCVYAYISQSVSTKFLQSLKLSLTWSFTLLEMAVKSHSTNTLAQCFLTFFLIYNFWPLWFQIYSIRFTIAIWSFKKIRYISIIENY